MDKTLTPSPRTTQGQMDYAKMAYPKKKNTLSTI